MVPRFILTPYFLDQPLPGLELFIDPEWVINKPSLANTTPQARMVEQYIPLAKLVSTVLTSGELPVSIAGDCCSSIGVLAGLQQAGVEPTLIWFDAHGDFNTWETTPSGFLGGMPLAMLVGRGEQTIMEGVGNRVLPEDQVILSDGRDLDPGEYESLAASKVVHLMKVQDMLEYRLPPGPICSPGFSSIEATAYPTDSEYFYFLADCINEDGSHLFAVTDAEHNANYAMCGGEVP